MTEPGRLTGSPSALKHERAVPGNASTNARLASGCRVENGHPHREETVAPRHVEYEFQRFRRPYQRLESGTAPFRQSPSLLPLCPASVLVGRSGPPSRTVPVQTDQFDETVCTSAQILVQCAAHLDKSARNVCERQHRVVPIRPQDVFIGNVLVALDGVAVGASEQEIAPVELPVVMEALRGHVLHRQADRQAPFTVAAIASQPLHQVTNRIVISGVWARGRAAFNRPHFDLSILLARASSLRMAARPGFAE